MTPFPLVGLLYFYGAFLIVCGVISVMFIGMKAKTALLSGGMSGLLSIVIAYLVSIHVAGSVWAGIGLTLALFIVFSWRSTKTLFRIFELIPSGSTDLKGKGVAFLIISLMAVISLFVFTLQIIYR